MRKLPFLLTACTLLSAPLLFAEDKLPESSKASPFPFTPKNFDHLLGKVEGIDDALLKMHFKLYQGYVTNTNTLLQKIRELDSTKMNRTPEFAGLKRMLGWEMDGMLLHELYFENLGKNEPLKEGNPLLAKMSDDYGSFDKWKEDFIATGLMRGIGWVIAYIDPKDGHLTNVWVNEHDVGHIVAGNPLLVMDVWEHAYITEFGLDRAKYIDTFFNNINWDVVSKRFSGAK